MYLFQDELQLSTMILLRALVQVSSGLEMKIWFINGVDNVNWPPYRDWEANRNEFAPFGLCKRGVDAGYPINKAMINLENFK